MNLPRLISVVFISLALLGVQGEAAAQTGQKPKCKHPYNKQAKYTELIIDQEQLESAVNEVTNRILASIRAQDNPMLPPVERAAVKKVIDAITNNGGALKSLITNGLKGFFRLRRFP